MPGGGKQGGVCPPEQCPPGVQRTDSGAQPMPEGQAAKPKPEAPAEGQADGQHGRRSSPPIRPLARAASISSRPVSVRAISRRNRRRRARSAAKGKISDEQRTEIRNTIVETHVEPVDHVDFDISIGVAVPSTVCCTRSSAHNRDRAGVCELPVFRARGRDDHHRRPGKPADRLRHRIARSSPWKGAARAAAPFEAGQLPNLGGRISRLLRRASI